MVVFPFHLKQEKIKLKFKSQKNLRNIFKENFAKKWLENPRTVYGWLYKCFPRKPRQSRSLARLTSSYYNFYWPS
jgi:hypothetical protein